MIVSNIELKDMTEEDLPFLKEVYSDTRRTELLQTGWSEEVKKVFLKMQFDAQHKHYQKTYKNASYQLIHCEGIPVGRLYIDRAENEIRMIDIAILESHQKKGIGSALINSLLKEAEQADKTLSIHVEANNPAMRLYLRLGFKKISETGVYHFMEYRPNQNQRLEASPCD